MSISHDPSMVMEIAWSRTVDQLDALGPKPVELTIRDDDLALIEASTTAGFDPTDDVSVATWMSATERPDLAALPEGFVSASRSDDPSRPHHMIPRNGAHVAERLGECSLYRPELDLAIYAPNGELAAYGLFWADPVTGVGLLEPMRTEDAYQRIGLGRGLLTTGLHRLAAHGCSTFKVSYMPGNDASQRLYLSTGFQPTSTSRTYRRGHDRYR